MRTATARTLCALSLCAPRLDPARMCAPAGRDAGGVVLLEAEDVSLSYDGDRFLFRDLSLQLPRAAKWALVGTNGVGKSSLLRVLCGSEPSETGRVSLARGARLAYVPQEPSVPAGCTAGEFLYRSDAPSVSALRAYRAAEAAVLDAKTDSDASDASARLGAASAAMDEADAWGVEAEMRRVCEELRVAHLLRRDAGERLWWSHT